MTKYDLNTMREKLQDTRDSASEHRVRPGKTSPLDQYKHSGRHTIANAKRTCRHEDEALLEAIILDFQTAETKRGQPYGRLIISDGIERGIVMIWGKNLLLQDIEMLQVPHTGISLYVEYNEDYKTFSLVKNETIIKLPRM